MSMSTFQDIVLAAFTLLLFAAWDIRNVLKKILNEIEGVRQAVEETAYPEQSEESEGGEER